MIKNIPLLFVVNTIELNARESFLLFFGCNNKEQNTFLL